MITTPFCLYDCDVPVDGSTAVVVSAAEHARAVDHAASRGRGGRHRAARPAVVGPVRRPHHHGGARRRAQLWARTDLRPADVDVAELYDGFSFLALAWLEALGFCGQGEGGPFVEGGAHRARRRAAAEHPRRPALRRAAARLRLPARGVRAAPGRGGRPPGATTARGRGRRNGGGPVAGCLLLTRVSGLSVAGGARRSRRRSPRPRFVSLSSSWRAPGYRRSSTVTPASRSAASSTLGFSPIAPLGSRSPAMTKTGHVMAASAAGSTARRRCRTGRRRTHW